MTTNTNSPERAMSNAEVVAQYRAARMFSPKWSAAKREMERRDRKVRRDFGEGF